MSGAAQDWSNERKRLNGWGLQDLKVTSTRPIHLLQNAGPTSRPYKMTSLVKLKSITWRCEFHLICLRRASNSPEQPSKQHSLSYYCCSNESNWFNSNIHHLQNIKPYQNYENENPWWITFCHRHVAQRSSLALHLQGCIQIQHWVNLIFSLPLESPLVLLAWRAAIRYSAISLIRRNHPWRIGSLCPKRCSINFRWFHTILP